MLMPITAHRTVSTKTRPNGSIDAVFEYEWHTGEVTRQRWRLAAGTDVDAYRATRIPKTEASMVQAEITKGVRLAMKGVNPGNLTLQHQTQVEYDRRLLAALMQTESIETILGALDFWVDFRLRAGNNNNQRADYLGVPITEYQQVDGRLNDAQGVQGGVATVNAQVWNDIPSDSWQ